MPENVIGVEDRNRYDGIAYYEDKKGNRYSRQGHPISRSEMCKYWYIFDTIIVTDGPWKRDYHYVVMDARPDTIIINSEKWAGVKSKYIYYNRWLYKKLNWYGK